MWAPRIEPAAETDEVSPGEPGCARRGPDVRACVFGTKYDEQRVHRIHVDKRT